MSPLADSVVKSGVLPFWARVALRRSINDAARIATIALNIFGLLTGLLYLILRSNSSKMAFRPNAATWEKKQEWRLFGCPALGPGKHITNPVGSERRGTLHEVVLPSKEKSGFEARTTISRHQTNPASTQTTCTVLASPPFHGTLPESAISKPPPSSSSSYRAPPIPNATDLLPTSNSTIQNPPQMLRSQSPSQSCSQANYTFFPDGSASAPMIENDQSESLDPEPIVQPPPLLYSHHRRNFSNVSSATVQIGMRLSTRTEENEVEERIDRTVTYPSVPSHSKKNYWKDLSQRSLDVLPRPLEVKNWSRDSSPLEILFRLNSNEELPSEAAHITPLTRTKPLEDLVSPTRRVLSWRKFRNAKMKSLPPVPVTPSTMQPLSSYRASFPEPRTPVSPEGTKRASEERTALSLALNEDEQWPLHAVDMVMLSDRSYKPDQNRSWI